MVATKQQVKEAMLFMLEMKLRVQLGDEDELINPYEELQFMPEAINEYMVFNIADKLYEQYLQPENFRDVNDYINYHFNRSYDDESISRHLEVIAYDMAHISKNY
jgi:hypothetical protein